MAPLFFPPLKPFTTHILSPLYTLLLTPIPQKYRQLPLLKVPRNQNLREVMGLRALTRGNRHLCRQTNSQIASHSSFCCTRNVTCSFTKGKEFHYINTNSGHMVQGHLVRMNFGKFLPLGVRELSYLGENKVQIRTEEDSKEKEEAQAKEKDNRKHLRIGPQKSVDYYSMSEL